MDTVLSISHRKTLKCLSLLSLKKRRKIHTSQLLQRPRMSHLSHLRELVIEKSLSQKIQQTQILLPSVHACGVMWDFLDWTAGWDRSLLTVRRASADLQTEGGAASQALLFYKQHIILIYILRKHMQNWIINEIQKSFFPQTILSMPLKFSTFIRSCLEKNQRVFD